ncbi:hypothetical protein IWX90DRAFT_426699 [Phyllosticta citrichinensis]|uniref:Major facilitator superfamily (MFS) profile domain-containing protein n=1 Tax=Phyllosticta citrichinensis TaxID=1130410 RepID=A0ABR1XYT7_9PEZI
MVCIAAAGVAPNAGAQIAFRFLAGFFGSTPLTCAGGSIADLWSPLDRVYAFPVFANAAFVGPVLGPILGSFIATSPHVAWRMVEWTSLLLAFLILLLLLTLFQPETYSPILLPLESAPPTPPHPRRALRLRPRSARRHLQQPPARRADPAVRPHGHGAHHWVDRRLLDRYLCGVVCVLGRL